MRRRSGRSSWSLSLEISRPSKMMRPSVGLYSLMIVLDLDELRHLSAREIDFEPAARLERTGARSSQHVRRRALDRMQPRAPRGVEPRHALQQAKRVGMPRRAEQLLRRTDLHEH